MIISFNFTEFADAAADRTRLEAELVNPSTGEDDGKAKYEQRDDRTTFSVEIEGQNPDSVFEIKVDDITLATFSTDDSGFADFNMDSRDGDSIPSISSGNIIEVINSDGVVILSGTLVGTEGVQDTSSPTSPPDTEPISTTNVIIPFGAKDKDVTEFYSPNSISVNLGETVTWTNQDDADHTVTSRSSGVFNSGVFGTSQSFSNKFTIDGTFEYFCQLHPWMVGTVIAGKGGDVPISEPAPQPPTDTTPSLAPTPSTPQGSSQFTVTIPLGAAEQTITQFYSPNSISIKISDSVLWKNSDIGFHTVTSGKATPDGLFDSGLFGPGENFSKQFSSIGTFDYFCVVHPWMVGVVMVNESNSDTSQPIPESPEATISTDETLPEPQPAPSPESKILEVLIPKGSAVQTVEEYYLPSKISINTSDSIIWKNDDEGFHTVTSTEKGIFDSGLFGPAETFSFQFNKAGNFDYFCVVHPWMTGSVSVKGTEKTNQSEASKIILPPLKQMKNGVLPIDVVCNPGKNLLFKVSDDMPVCLKVKSIPKLLDRSWAKIS